MTLVPYLKASGELKTKPTQASVKELQGLGLRPDVLVCRSEYPLTVELKDKIALFCMFLRIMYSRIWMWSISMKRLFLWRRNIWPR